MRLQVVPAMLRAMFGLLDRLAALQLGLQPYAITRAPTGVIMVNYGVSAFGVACSASLRQISASWSTLAKHPMWRLMVWA